MIQLILLDYCLSEAKNADIIHIHSDEELVFKIRKAFGNSKKIILHYHGTDIRGLKNKNNPESSAITEYDELEQNHLQLK